MPVKPGFTNSRYTPSLERLQNFVFYLLCLGKDALHKTSQHCNTKNATDFLKTKYNLIELYILGIGIKFATRKAKDWDHFSL